MDRKHLQQSLFQQIRTRIPDQISFADSIARVLEISNDSAYRRIRCESMLDLDETQKLCHHFKISMDAIMGLNDGKIIFESNLSYLTDFDFEDYMRGVLRNMQYFHSFEEKKMYYECKDIPIFVHFHSRELAAFKYYFWMKFLLQQPSYRNKKFSLEDYPDAVFNLGKQVYDLYNTIPSVEFWSIESISSMLRQIRFFNETGCFTRKSDVKLIYERFLEFINHFENITAKGRKEQIYNTVPDKEGEALDVFHNEVILGNNLIIAKLGNSQLTFLNHSIFNYAVTSNVQFAEYTLKYKENLIKSSTRISSNNEVERMAFFASIRGQIMEHIRLI
jgi:hypothetical protein